MASSQHPRRPPAPFLRPLTSLRLARVRSRLIGAVSIRRRAVSEKHTRPCRADWSDSTPGKRANRTCAGPGALHAPLACLPQLACWQAGQACGGFEPSSRRGFSHDAVRENATGIQIRLRISRISSSRKQLWVGYVFFRFGTSRLQEFVEAEEFAAEGGAVGGPFVVAGGSGEGYADGGELGIEAGGASLTG